MTKSEPMRSRAACPACTWDALAALRGGNSEAALSLLDRAVSPHVHTDLIDALDHSVLAILEAGNPQSGFQGRGVQGKWM